MLRKEGLTQAQIGEKIGWSRENVSRYTMLINKIAPQVLVLVREHQKGRGAKNAPSGAFDFTEGFKIVIEYVEAEKKPGGYKEELTEKNKKIFLSIRQNLHNSHKLYVIAV